MMATATTIAVMMVIAATVAVTVITAMTAVATKVSQTLQGCEDHTATVVT